MRIFVNHIGLDYSVEGEGRPLILLHGNGEDRHIFDAGIGYLKPYFKVYSVDSRGHGCSDPVEEYHYADMAEDMHQFVRKLGIEDPIVFGYSDGGIIGLLWASKHPEDIGTLIAAGANTRPEALKGFSVALMKRRNARNPDPLVTMMLTEPHITVEMLARITVPTVIVRASRDCIDEDDTDFMVRSIPNSKKYVMKRADHGSYIVGSPRFADIIFKETGLIRATFGHPPLSFIYHPPVMTNGMQHGGSRRCIRARAEGPPLGGGQGTHQDGEDLQLHGEGGIRFDEGEPLPGHQGGGFPGSGPGGPQMGFRLPDRGQELWGGCAPLQQEPAPHRSGQRHACGLLQVPPGPDIRLQAQRGQGGSVEDIHDTLRARVQGTQCDSVSQDTQDRYNFQREPDYALERGDEAVGFHPLHRHDGLLRIGAREGRQNS